MKSLSLLAAALLLTACSAPVLQPAAEYDPSLPACIEEDASTPNQPLPCVWDSSIRGNGTGLSYIVNPDSTIAMLSVIPVEQFDSMKGM